jgi:predicted dehydrogenase|tara:strand:- start:690 stop:1553 length:864 start_codon:yes stop_codon:yes gene_type:complete
MNLAIIGVGYWGSKIAETARLLPNTKVKTFDIDDNYQQDSIDAAVVATPAETHYEVTKSLLERGIACLVEKPIADTLNKVQHLIGIAEAKNTVLQSGHILLFTPTTEYIKRTFDTANLRFVETRRLNFGNIPKHQISLEHHLLIHDLALIDYIKQEKIIAVQRSGRDILTTDYNDYTITNIDFETFSTTHHCSWFYPRKTRTVALTSANQLVHVDDVDLQVHHVHGHYTDRLVNESTNTIQLSDSATPLYRELEHFVASVEKQDHNSINGLAHIERVYKNLERVTDV